MTVFHTYADGRVRCKRCVGEAVSRRHHRVKAELVAECGGCCAVCGYGRTLRIPMTMARGKSIAAYRAEAAKCVLVCANCHGEIEAGLIPTPPPGTRFWP